MLANKYNYEDYYKANKTHTEEGATYEDTQILPFPTMREQEEEQGQEVATPLPLQKGAEGEHNPSPSRSDIYRKPTTTQYKSDGILKPTAADPIRDASDVQKMLTYFLDKGKVRDYTFLTLGISFALRAGDLLSLKIEDVFNLDGTVKSHFVIYEDKTNKRQKVHINEKCKEALSLYLDSLDDVYSTDPLFMSRQRDQWGNKKAITIQQAITVLKKAAKECGVKGHISSHSMRKTFAYHTIKNNEGNQEVLLMLQHMYKHTDIKTTFRYCGIEEEQIDALREDIGGILL
ncbi:integrase [Clostridiales Family XIII bacterium PM5-7]